MSQVEQFEKVNIGGQDSAYATAATSFSAFPRVQSCNINGNNQNIYDRGMGEGLNVSNTYYGPYSCSGDITAELVDFDMLKYWVGPKSGSGTSVDPYVLTEATNTSLDTNNLQVFTIEKKNDSESSDAFRFAIGCVGTTFTLSADIGKPLQFSGQFIARHDGYKSTGASYSANTEAAYVMIGGSWKWGSTPSALAGVRSFTINMVNDVTNDDGRSLESRFITQPKLKTRVYTYAVDIIMSTALATTIINDFYGYSSGGVYTPEDGSNSISPASNLEFKIELINGSKYATVWLDVCDIDRISKPSNVGGGISVLRFEGSAHKGKDNAPIKWWTV